MENKNGSRIGNFLKSALVLTGARQAAAAEDLPSFFTLKAAKPNGAEQNFADFQGKVVLAVNVASQCGFTNQYRDLEALHQKYKDQGLVVLGFPSNDFGGQEPGSDDEIQKFCSLNFGVTFPVFKKGPVKGEQIQPVYKYLTVDAGPGMGGAVLWNFEKFLIDRKGRLVNRFRSVTNPSSKKFEAEIQKLLAAK